MSHEKVITLLQTLVNKHHLFLTESGDHAIRAVLQKLPQKNILIQDQGGWLTYTDYAKKEGKIVVIMKTDDGIINLTDLEQKADEHSAVLLNSLTGYCAEQPMARIAAICAQKKCLLINDVSGSIGTDTAKIGDIILCSFGKDKPINLHYGGCIATNQQLQFEGTFDATKLDSLANEIKQLPDKLQRWRMITATIKKDLATHDIIHRTKHGINVIVKFNNEQEKQALIAYCAQHTYDYTVCPRSIRVMTPAISIEVKRLK